MADDAARATDPAPTQPPVAPRGLVDTARRVLGQVAARMPGLGGGAAQRNAWEAVCADLQRRQQWNDVVDLAVNATLRPSHRRSTGARQTSRTRRSRSQAQS